MYVFEQNEGHTAGGLVGRQAAEGGSSLDSTRAWRSHTSRLLRQIFDWQQHTARHWSRAIWLRWRKDFRLFAASSIYPVDVFHTTPRGRHLAGFDTGAAIFSGSSSMSSPRRELHTDRTHFLRLPVLTLCTCTRYFFLSTLCVRATTLAVNTLSLNNWYIICRFYRDAPTNAKKAYQTAPHRYFALSPGSRFSLGQSRLACSQSGALLCAAACCLSAVSHI